MLVGIIPLLAVVTLAHASEPVALSGKAMGTTWSVKWIQPAAPLAPALLERRVAERIEQLEQQFSTYRPESVLARFNASGGTDWIPVPPELAQVTRQARDLSVLTGGAYDATVHPLVQLWGFGTQRRDGVLPEVAEIAQAWALVDWRQLEVRTAPPALRKTRAGITADFSSMAKGFTADAVSELLGVLGAPNHLVLIGGDVRSGGAGGEGTGWRVAIEQPVETAVQVAAVVGLNGEALSTSGDYRNFFQAGGRRYGHIIDPRTGRPVSGELAAVSVIAASGARSSALATALFVLGAEEGLRLATAEGWAVLFQLRSEAKITRRATPEFEQRLRDLEIRVSGPKSPTAEKGR